MEKTSAYEKIRENGANNFSLAGRVINNDAFDKIPLKQGHVYTKGNLWKLKIEEMLKNASTIEDLNALGAKFNEAIDNKYDVDIWDYQLQAAKKMNQIYTKLGMKI